MNPTSTNFETPPPAPAQPADQKSAELPVWLQRVFAIVYVLFCIELGLVLVVLAWWPGFWFAGTSLVPWPELRRVLSSGFVRGAVSGLGLLDIWLGVIEAVRYQDRR